MRAAAIGFESGFHRRGDARIVFSSTGFNLNIIANIDFESGFHRRGDARIVFSPTGFNLNIIANLYAREIFHQSHLHYQIYREREGCPTRKLFFVMGAIMHFTNQILMFL